MDTKENIPQLLTVRQVLDRLQVSRTTLSTLRKEGKISAVIVGERVRFTESEVSRFIVESTENSMQGTNA